MFDINIEDKCDNSRSCELRIGFRRFNTPSYGLIHTDMKTLIRGSNLIGNPVPPVNFHEIVIDLIDNDITKYKDTYKKRIEKNYRSDLINLCQFRFSSDITLSPSQLEELIKIQIDSEKLSVITIPDAILRDAGKPWLDGLNPSLEIAEEACETGISYASMPTVSLEQPIEYVEKKIDWLLTRNIQSICLRATGQFSPRLRKAAEILKKIEEPIWTHLYDLKKKYLEVSQIHLAPLANIDTITPKKYYSATMFHITKSVEVDKKSSDFPTPIGVPLTVKTREPKKKVIRDLFEGKALGYLTEKERIKSYGHNLTCNCAICQKTKSIDELEKFLSRLDRKALLQIHETVSFSDELSQISKAIHNNDLVNYYKNKKLVIENRKELMKKFPYLERTRYKKLW